MSEYFLGAFVTIATIRSPALTARKHTCDRLHLRLHKPHEAILTAARFTFTVFCTGYPLHTDCCLFYLPRRAGILSRNCLLRDWTRTSCAHEWTCGGAVNDLTNWASQTDNTSWHIVHKLHSLLLVLAALLANCCMLGAPLSTCARAAADFITSRLFWLATKGVTL